MELRDRLEIADKRLTADGYLVATARAARTGVQHYLGTEVKRPDLAVARVYRPADEVFREDSLATYAFKPVTNDHPAEMVTSHTWKDVAVGNVGPKIVRDGEYVSVPLMLADVGAIGAVDNGKRELSAGYSCEIDWVPGVTPTGEAYDGVQRNIRVNHVAVVDAGRAGSECRIGDQSTHHQPEPVAAMTTIPALQTVLIDGVSVQVSDTAAQLIAKQNKMVADATAETLAAKAAIEAGKVEAARQIETKDGEIAAIKVQHQKDIEAKDGEIAVLKTQVLDGAGIEKKAAERSQLVTTVKAILGDAAFDSAGKSDMDLKKLAVAKALGDAAKDLTDAGIDGAFRAVAARVGPINDPIRNTLMGDGRLTAVPNAGMPTNMADADKAREQALADMKARLESAWKPKAA
jgi:hypothetical protein